MLQALVALGMVSSFNLGLAGEAILAAEADSSLALATSQLDDLLKALRPPLRRK